MKHFYTQLKENYQKKAQYSFSLLEAIVAVAILLVTVSSVMNIVYEGAVASRFQQDRLIANYLAADAVEYLRSQRDSSLASGNSFSNWLNSSRIQRCVRDSSNPDQSCRIDSRPGSASIDTCSGNCRPLDYDEGSGLYGYNSNWAESQFVRELYIETRQGSDEAKMTASVSWERSGDTASVVLNESVFSIEPYSAFAEAGTVSVNGDTWESIDFDTDYAASPLVFATTQTMNGSEEDISAQVRGVSTSGFEGRFCEYDGGDSCDTHTDETVGYIAADADRVNTFDNMEAGTVDMPSGTEVTQSVSFNKSFDNTPYVYAMTQTDNTVGDPQALRVYSVDTNGFTVEYCDQSGTDSCEDHATETVGYWAIDPTEADKGGEFDWGKVSNVADDTWENISFSQSYSSAPAVIAVVQGNNGGQQAMYPQVQNVDSSGAEIRFCEAEGDDSCDTHNSNDMVWMSAPKMSIHP